MNIGFDAKRAFHNNTGLGNYSRTLIDSLGDFFPENEYFLFNPKKSDKYFFRQGNIHEILPQKFLHKKLSSAWRSKWVKEDLRRLHIDLYHGLSHEIPVGIEDMQIKSVVTIHDLIFERYPEQFSKIDFRIYHAKFLNASLKSDKVIAISEQTKQDLTDFYKISPEKIEVCYQSCDAIFGIEISDETLRSVKEKYQLPNRFFLSVGSIIERKNLLNICKAIYQTKENLNAPLVVIGKGKNTYRKEIDTYIKQRSLEHHIIFLSEKFENETSVCPDLPAIYKLSEALIYPSFFEGFGIPILEAFNVGVPVITSNVSCLPEAGGDAAYYVNPNSVEQISVGMEEIFKNKTLVNEMVNKGKLHAKKFTPLLCAQNVMDVYKKIMNFGDSDEKSSLLKSV